MNYQAWVSIIRRGVGVAAIIACGHGKAWALQSHGCVPIASCQAATLPASETVKPPVPEQIAQAEQRGLLTGLAAEPTQQSGEAEGGPQPLQGLLAGARQTEQMQSQVVPEPGQLPRGLLAGAIRGNEAAPGGTGVAAPSGRGLLAGAIKGN
jgi:hypothetical protein